MKILHYADPHITEGPRLEDQERVLAFIEETATDQKVGLVLIAGDLTNHQPRRATPRERAIIRKHLQTLGEQCPVVIVRGNHDYLLDWEFLNHLESAHPVRYVERAQVVQLVTSGGEIDILAIPWPDRGHLADKVEGSREDINEMIRRALRGILVGMEQQSHGRPRVGLAHCNLVGTTIDNGQPLIGDDFELGIEDLSPVAPLWCLGHIHKHQVFESGGVRLVFAGAPMQHKHGTVDQRVICIHEVDAETGASQGMEAIPTPYRPLRTVDLWFRPDADDQPGYFVAETKDTEATWLTREKGAKKMRAHIANAEVRVRVFYQEALADAFDRRAVRDRVKALGAYSVKLEATPLSEVKVRAPRIVEVKSLRGKLDVFLEEKGKALEGEAADKLAAALVMLETNSPEEVLAHVQAQADEFAGGLV